MHYYQILKNLREDNDLTQNEISKRLYLGKNTYFNYENGIREFPFTTVVELAKLYNVSLDYIAGLTDNKKGIGNISEEEKQVIKLYNQLSEQGKGRIKERMNILINGID